MRPAIDVVLSVLYAKNLGLEFHTLNIYIVLQAGSSLAKPQSECFNWELEITIYSYCPPLSIDSPTLSWMPPSIVPSGPICE